MKKIPLKKDASFNMLENNSRKFGHKKSNPNIDQNEILAPSTGLEYKNQKNVVNLESIQTQDVDLETKNSQN